MPATPRADQDVIRPIDQPMYAARPPRDPEGQPRARGRGREDHRPEEPGDHRPGARVRRRAIARWPRSWRDKIMPGDVMVLRYLGPKGGPGMPEMLAPTRALIGQGLGESVGLDHRRPLLGRHLGHGRRPRRAGGATRAARSRSCSEGDSITIDAHRLLLQLERRRRRARARAAPHGSRRRRATRAACSQSSPTTRRARAAARCSTPTRACAPCGARACPCRARRGSPCAGRPSSSPSGPSRGAC